MAKARKPKAAPPENRGDREAETGRFKPGVSGNPGGRPKDAHGLSELARTHGPKALSRLVALMGSKDERVVIAACSAVLDRGYGKPSQALEHTGIAGGAIERPFTNLELARRVAFSFELGMRERAQTNKGDTP